MAIGNTSGEDLMAKYIGTAYDAIKFVADNLTEIQALSVDISAVTSAVALAEADKVQTGLDRIQTALDVITSAADVLKASKWAKELEDTPVESGQFSAMHWALKASASAASINGILTTANTFTLANTYNDEIVLANTANLVSPLKMTSTGAVGIQLTAGGFIRYLGVNTSGEITYGTNADVVSNPRLLITGDVNTSSAPFAASVLTVATSATVAGANVLTADNAGVATVDWAAKDLVVANSLTINGLAPYTSVNSNTTAIDWTMKNLVVAGTAAITGVIVAGAVPTLDTHLCNKLYVDAKTATASATYADNVKLGIGSSQDMTLFHNGVNSNIENITGHINVTNKAVGQDISLAVTCDDGNLDTVLTIIAGTSDNSTIALRYGDVQKVITAVDGIAVAGVVSGSVAPTDVDHLTRKDYVDSELNTQTHTMSQVSGNVPVSQVPVAVNNASAGAGFGGFRYTTEDAGATLNLFTT